EFKSTLLHTSVSMVSDAAENRAKSARVRAILDRARTRRAPWSAQIRGIDQKLSERDFARSVDHRRKFACGPLREPSVGTVRQHPSAYAWPSRFGKEFGPDQV